jgi:type II secretory pathway pseudopilin PulG
MTRRRDHTRKGFNLIESAIVLGVVGFVIGGIWVVAASVQENQKVNSLANGLILGVSNLQRNITETVAASLPRDVNGYAFLVNYCVAAKVFPDDFYKGNKIVTPFGGDVLPAWDNANGGDINCVIIGNYIGIEVGAPTKAICLKLTSAITSKFHDNSILAKLIVYGNNVVSTGSNTSWPLSPSGTQCNVVYPADIKLYFNFLSH